MSVELKEILRNGQTTAEAAQQNGKRIQLIVFKLGTEEYALPIEQIKEVVITPHISKVPRTPDYIRGVANIRGNVIAIMDLEDKFNLAKSERAAQADFNYTLVIESEDYKVGVLVNEVPNTLNTFESSIDNSASIMQYSSLDEDCITGVVKVESRMIILIDIIKMVQNQNIANVN